MATQSYVCDECGLQSHITYSEREGVISGIHKIQADHKKWSPECQCPLEELRAVNAEAV